MLYNQAKSYKILQTSTFPLKLVEIYTFSFCLGNFSAMFNKMDICYILYHLSVCESFPHEALWGD